MKGFLARWKERAREAMAVGRPTNWAAAAVIVVIWLALKENRCPILV